MSWLVSSFSAPCSWRPLDWRIRHSHLASTLFHSLGPWWRPRRILPQITRLSQLENSAMGTWPIYKNSIIPDNVHYLNTLSTVLTNNSVQVANAVNGEWRGQQQLFILRKCLSHVCLLVLSIAEVLLVLLVVVCVQYSWSPVSALSCQSSHPFQTECQ